MPLPTQVLSPITAPTNFKASTPSTEKSVNSLESSSFSVVINNQTTHVASKNIPEQTPLQAPKTEPKIADDVLQGFAMLLQKIAVFEGDFSFEEQNDETSHLMAESEQDTLASSLDVPPAPKEILLLDINQKLSSDIKGGNLSVDEENQDISLAQIELVEKIQTVLSGLDKIINQPGIEQGLQKSTPQSLPLNIDVLAKLLKEIEQQLSNFDSNGVSGVDSENQFNEETLLNGFSKLFDATQSIDVSDTQISQMAGALIESLKKLGILESTISDAMKSVQAGLNNLDENFLPNNDSTLFVNESDIDEFLMHQQPIVVKTEPIEFSPLKHSNLMESKLAENGALSKNGIEKEIKPISLLATAEVDEQKNGESIDSALDEPFIKSDIKLKDEVGVIKPEVSDKGAMKVEPSLIMSKAETVADEKINQSKIEKVISDQINAPIKNFHQTVQLNQTMSERMMLMINNNVQKAIIRLDPAELGPMEIQIQLQGNETQVHIQSANSVVRDTLEHQLLRLREMLENEGFANVDVDVSDQSKNDESKNGAQHETGDTSGEETESLATAKPVGLVDQFV